VADEVLFRENVTFYLAFEEAFADIDAIEADEINDGITAGLVFNVTCALNEDGTTFDLGESDSDDSLSFCQAAGSVSPTFQNPEIIYEAFRSFDPTDINTANTTFGLLAFPDVEYVAIVRVGGAPDADVAVGDRLRAVTVKTDYPVDVYGENENIRLTQNFLNAGWVVLPYPYEVAA
jgi:hypothetical protein